MFEQEVVEKERVMTIKNANGRRLAGDGAANEWVGCPSWKRGG